MSLAIHNKCTPFCMKWRYSENIRNMEITRKRVNRGVRSYIKIGGYAIRHLDFDDKHPALLKQNGVHLLCIANDIFLNQMQGALETFLKYPYCLVYPLNWDKQMRILDHTRDVPGDISERIAIVSLTWKSNSTQGTRSILLHPQCIITANGMPL
jgi:hypothetical protein